MKHLWYRCWHWFCLRVYFERVTVVHPERLPEAGPVLHVVLHRNGAVDGFIYHEVVPRGVFLISTQLRRSFFARLFFHGIAVARKEDEGDRARNEEALRQCGQVLAARGRLIIFPEGTSSLGPRHLPFKSGAARVALDALARGVPLRIVPLGIHYQRAWAFRSRVEVVVGEPPATEMSPGLSEFGRLKEMNRRMTAALEAVGANFPTAEAQADAERLACIATLGARRGYFEVLKSLEAGVPEPWLGRGRELESQFGAHRVLRHQGVPLVPAGPWVIDAARLLGLGPLVLAGAGLNLPPLLAGWLAARQFADDRNVVALWRILVGVPVFVLWLGAVTILLAVWGGWGWALGYALLTLAALKSVDRVQRLVVTVWNGLALRALARRVQEFHQAVRTTLAAA